MLYRKSEFIFHTSFENITTFGVLLWSALEVCPWRWQLRSAPKHSNCFNV